MQTPACRELPYPPECCDYINPLEILFAPGSHSVGVGCRILTPSVRSNILKTLRTEGTRTAWHSGGRRFDPVQLHQIFQEVGAIALTSFSLDCHDKKACEGVPTVVEPEVR